MTRLRIGALLTTVMLFVLPLVPFTRAPYVAQASGQCGTTVTTNIYSYSTGHIATYGPVTQWAGAINAVHCAAYIGQGYAWVQGAAACAAHEPGDLYVILNWNWIFHVTSSYGSLEQQYDCGDL